MGGMLLLYVFLAILLGSIIGTIICVIKTPKGEKYNWEVAQGIFIGIFIIGAIMGITYLLTTYFLA
ncbi:hypothetical protein V7024_06165 [Bacillus sp. JJ864]|uniref:hypothetical protein n=1 Tax=Bacillus sp. JJ864 TaxID=3122975 RepID=UPI002FFF2F1C